MPDVRLSRTVLHSGIRVLSERVPGVRSISLGVWVDAGSRDENEEQRGLTHFLEHMLFKGTPRYSAKQIAEAFENLGADINAATGKEYTSFYSRILEHYLEDALGIIMDMIRNSVLEEKDVESERMVVLEEIAMHLDSPDDLVHDYLARGLWGDHPLGKTVLGEPPVIRGISRGSLMGFYRERYEASRLVVAAAGAIDHDTLCGVVLRESEGIPAGDPVVRDDAPDRVLSSNCVYPKDTEQAHLCLGSRGLPRNHPDRFALAVMDNILGGTMSSRLFQSIREEKGLAYSIYSYSGMFVGAGMVGIYCGTGPENAQRVIFLIEEELSRIQRGGFTDAELERARNHIKGSLLISMEESSNRMSRIAKTELSGGDHLTVEEMVEKVERVSTEDAHRVFMETWGSGILSMAVIGPFSETELCLSGVI